MNSCLLRKRIFLFIFLSSTFNAFTQQSEIETTIAKEYVLATRLYQSNAFAAAQLKFTSISKQAPAFSNLKAEAKYYEALCALELNDAEAVQKVLQFALDYPNNNKKNSAYFKTGNHYFNRKEFANAAQWYQKVAPNSLLDTSKKELTFKLGYCLLNTKELNAAKNLFAKLLTNPNYGNDAKYYYGYIAYKQEDYPLATTILQEITTHKSYEDNIAYYLLDINFKREKFEEAIKTGKELLKKEARKNKYDIHKIIGESYFNLEKYAAAIPYLKDYQNNSTTWNNTDYYRLGFAYYKENDIENAINNFNKIIDAENEVAQNAYYNLGECYLKMGKKIEALSAFKAAAGLNYSSKIKEDAALNYAKLSYEEGNPFYPVATVLQDFLKQYPSSKSYTLINEALITSYIYQQDYQGALAFLAQKSSKASLEKVYEISLYRGIQLFNNNTPQNALPFFASAKKSTNKEISAKATYWEGEAHYELGNYKEALANFMAFKNNPDAQTLKAYTYVNYQIAYGFFKRKEYSKAAQFFEAFLKKNENNSENKDALLRLADCEFATKEYRKAIKAYEKVIANGDFGSDYAQYQAAICFGFMGDNIRKIEGLKNLLKTYPKATLIDDALFQIGTTYSILKENNKAHEAFDLLIANHKKSVFVPKALMRQGLLYYNENTNDLALKLFKEVVKKYPNSQEAIEAVASARNIYIDTGNVDEYAAWTKTLKFMTFENSDIDNAKFTAAEKQYITGDNPQQKINSLLDYLKSFPKGIHVLKVNFYLAETYSAAKNFEAAKEAYEKVIEQGQNDFSEKSLVKLSQIYLSEEKYSLAIPLLKRLELEAFAAENITFAQSNLMQGYSQTKAFELAIAYAELLLSNQKLALDIRNDAKLIIARAAIANNDFIKAKKYYAAVEKEAEGILKAEALYYNAVFKNQNKEYGASNKVILNIISNYSSYKYWGVKSYLIMAKNYYGLKDVYQATYVLENIIANFSQFEELIIEAKTTLNAIKANEAKNNKSITPKN